jgi:hypothetical protein
MAEVVAMKSIEELREIVVTLDRAMRRSAGPLAADEAWQVIPIEQWVAKPAAIEAYENNDNYPECKPLAKVCRLMRCQFATCLRLRRMMGSDGDAAMAYQHELARLNQLVNTHILVVTAWAEGRVYQGDI